MNTTNLLDWANWYHNGEELGKTLLNATKERTNNKVNDILTGLQQYL